MTTMVKMMEMMITIMIINDDDDDDDLHTSNILPSFSKPISNYCHHTWPSGCLKESSYDLHHDEIVEAVDL